MYNYIILNILCQALKYFIILNSINCREIDIFVSYKYILKTFSYKSQTSGKAINNNIIYIYKKRSFVTIAEVNLQMEGFLILSWIMRDLGLKKVENHCSRQRQQHKAINTHNAPYAGSEWFWSQQLGESLGSGRHHGSGYCSTGKWREKRSINHL